MTIPDSFDEISEHTAPLSHREIGVWLGLVETVDSVRALLDEQVRDIAGITIVQFGILQRLLAAPAGVLSMTEIADGLVTSRSGITYQVDKLEAAGMVERRASTRDERSVEVRVTEVGRDRIAEFLPQHTALVRHLLLDRIDDAQLSVLESVVGDVRAQLALAPPRSVRRRANQARRQVD